MITALIIDDSAVFRASMRRVLATRYAFMHIGEAATARDAVDHAHTLRPDLLFVDVRLPDGSGFALTQLLRAAMPESVVCIVTSFDLPEYRSAARDCGAPHFLAKGGSTSAEVIAIVEAILAKRVRTLVIDDDPGRRSAIADSVLQRWPKMVVIEASDGNDGRKKALALKPDVILAELSLLATIGPTLRRAINTVNAAATIVAIDRHREPADHETAQRCGADFAVAGGANIVAQIAATVHAVLRHEGAGLPPMGTT